MLLSVLVLTVHLWTCANFLFSSHFHHFFRMQQLYKWKTIQNKITNQMPIKSYSFQEVFWRVMQNIQTMLISNSFENQVYLIREEFDILIPNKMFYWFCRTSIFRVNNFHFGCWCMDWFLVDEYILWWSFNVVAFEITSRAMW